MPEDRHTRYRGVGAAAARQREWRCTRKVPGVRPSESCRCTAAGTWASRALVRSYLRKMDVDCELLDRLPIFLALAVAVLYDARRSDVNPTLAWSCGEGLGSKIALHNLRTVLVVGFV
jgi:hypothetical protein